MAFGYKGLTEAGWTYHIQNASNRVLRRLDLVLRVEVRSIIKLRSTNVIIEVLLPSLVNCAISSGNFFKPSMDKSSASTFSGFFSASSNE